MNRRYGEAVIRTLGTPRSRRQVLGTAAKGTLGGVGAAMLGKGLSDSVFEGGIARAARAQAVPCPATGEPFVRRDIYDLKEPEIASLRKGVAEMMRRSEVDPADKTGWRFQANLHAIPGILTPSPVWCQHLSWFFFPWHRIYLYWFERILRDASGDPMLTLPYWNYSDVPERRKLPEAFRMELDPDGNPNPLYTPRRVPGINDGSEELTAGGVDYSLAFDDDHKKFWLDPGVPGVSFGGDKIDMAQHVGTRAGQLEATPHGPVHTQVGDFFASIPFGVNFPAAGVVPYHCEIHPSMQGTINVIEDPNLPVQGYLVQIVDNEFSPNELTVSVGSDVFWANFGDSPHTATADDDGFDSGEIRLVDWMTFTEVSARDPIFWLHHCNIDRLWQRWLAKGDGRVNPTDQPEWMDQEFTFYDIDQSEKILAVSQTVDPVGCLGYRYDDPATVITPVPEPDAASAVISATPAAVAAADVRVLGETAGNQRIELSGARTSVVIELAPQAEAAMTSIASGDATPEAGAAPAQIILTLEGMRYQGGPLDSYDVYFNLPTDAEPDPAGEYFVGSIYLFGLLMYFTHGMPGEGMRQDFLINRVARTLEDRGDLQGDPEVTFTQTHRASTAASAATPGAEGGVTLGPAITIERATLSAVS